MSHPNKQPRRSLLALLKRAAVWTLGGGLIVAVPLLAYFLWLVRGPLFASPPTKPTEQDPRMQDMPVRFTVDDIGRVYPRADLPGLAAPPVRAADDAKTVEDDDEILGILAGGRARAYFVRAMGFPWHVINDMVGGRAVSVTYCDRARCARVFTDESAKAPLRLDIAGQMKDGLILRIGNVEYAQKSGENLTSPKGAPIPYADWTFVRTTWRAWRESHPDTDIYVGDLPSPMTVPADAVEH